MRDGNSFARLRRVIAGFACFLTVGCASYPTMTERTALLAPTMQYYGPEPGGGSAPLVILVSGCGGLVGLQGPKTIMRNYASAATQAGAYVAVMDSFASRGIDFETSVRMVCSGLQLHGDERAGDIIAVEKLARQHWNVDFTGVIVAGWSHGGWTVMELLSAGPKARQVGGFQVDAPSRSLTPDAVALYYPYCGFLNSTGRSTWAYKGPLLLLTPGEGAGTPSDECVQAVEHARGGLDGAEIVGYPGNTHAFDEEDQVPGSEFKYDVEAAARAQALFQRFVKQQVDRLR